MVLVSVIIVNWNTNELLGKSLHSVYSTMEDTPFEVIVVDNGSSESITDLLISSFPDVRLIQNSDNVGFPRANNQAARIASGKYLLLLNSDAFLQKGTIQEMLNLAQSNENIGLVGAQLRNLDGSFQASFTSFPNLIREFLILSGLGRVWFSSWFPSHGPEEHYGPQRVDYVEGACMLVNKSKYFEVGGLDEQYFMYAEDVELCYAMKKHGWQVWYHPGAKVVHVGSASSKDRRPERESDLYLSRVRFFRTHYGDRAACLLKLQIYFFTTLKLAYHHGLRFISGGRAGRLVVSLSYLKSELKKV